jgi:hypothetical protein
VYHELHRIAKRYMSDEGDSHTLQTTALVSEASYGQKTRPTYSRRPEPERIALLVSMINQAGRSSCDGAFPVSLLYALIVSPVPAVTSTLCRFPLVVLQQTSQSFSTPHSSFVPFCFRPRRKQDPVVFALVIALLVVMYEILLQCSPQRRFSKQDQPR